MRRYHLPRTRLTQGPHIIDDVYTGIQHRLHHASLVGVHRDRHIQTHSLAHHRKHARQLFFQRHNRCAGTRGLTANVQDVCALFEQLFAMCQSCMRVGVLTAIRERVGRDIDNAHHQRLAEVQAKTCGLPKHKCSMRNGAFAPSLCQSHIALSGSGCWIWLDSWCAATAVAARWRAGGPVFGWARLATRHDVINLVFVDGFPFEQGLRHGVHLV